jgi:hypothetical protein
VLRTLKPKTNRKKGKEARKISESLDTLRCVEQHRSNQGDATEHNDG